MLIDGDEDQLELFDDTPTDAPEDEVLDDQAAESAHNDEPAPQDDDAPDADDELDDQPVEQEPDAVDEPPARPSRGSRRIQELANQRTELERRAKEAEDRERALRQQIQNQEAARIQAQNTAAQEAYERMTPEERVQYDIQQFNARLRYDEQRREFQAAQDREKAEFSAKAATNPIYSRFQNEVEEHIKGLHAKGVTLPREAVIRYLIGEKFLKQTEKNIKPAAPQKVRKVSKAPTSRGDVRAPHTKVDLTSDRDARRERLKDVLI